MDVDGTVCPILALQTAGQMEVGRGGFVLQACVSFLLLLPWSQERERLVAEQMGDLQEICHVGK